MTSRPSSVALVLNKLDNVEVVLDDGSDMHGHKRARHDIAAGEPIIKLGENIGVAIEPIRAGEHVHTHNVAADRRPVSVELARTNLVESPSVEPRTFDGFMRADGRVGTRNHIVILTSVNCGSSVARAIAHGAREVGRHHRVDGITALTHQGGCGIGVDSASLANLRRTIAGYATHPNVGGALIVGLGCEVNQIAALLDEHGLAEGERLRVIGIQDEGGSAATIARGIEFARGLVEVAADDARSTVPVAHLALALQCGGSDGFSAITANPALGYASDLLVAHGATSVLGETPEMHGAEHLLVRRAVSGEVAQLLLDRLAWWRQHSEPEDNPSPGNKKGGLTTIAEKSLGAVAKGGTSPLVDVLRYAEPLRAQGFVVMDSPGFDPCSVTGEIASGCNLVCFTTGRGNVAGFVPVPTLKVATNTAMYERMSGDMDVNAGTIATGDDAVDEVGRRLFELVIETASGRQTASERLGFGESDFVPWQTGVVT
jgi:altronate dehydratase